MSETKQTTEMGVGTENLEEAPSFRAHDKNTLANSSHSLVFILSNHAETLEHVLNKYHFKTITHGLTDKDTHSIQEINDDYINKTRKRIC